MYDFSQYLQLDFLSRYVHLPLTVQNVIATMTVVAVLVMAVYYLLLFLGGERLSDRLMNYVFLRISLFVLSVLEIASYHLCPDADPSFFGGHLDGWIWTILRWAIIGVVFVAQAVLIPHLLEGNGVRTFRHNSSNILRRGALLFGASMLASFLFRGLWPYCGLIGLGAIALQIVSDLVLTVRNRSSVLAFLWNSVWMIVCCLAVMVWSTKIVPLFIFLFFVYSFLEGMLHSGDACCANCRTFDDGYCHFHRQYRSSGDYCNRWEASR